ncbi:MAG: hypothetical protein AAF721_00205 [Myxococcota bacterium]
MARVLRALVVVVLVLATGCVTARNYADPRQRVTHGTAYALTNREVRVDAGAVGTELADVGANIDVAAGFGRGGQVSTNLAHLGLGLVNAAVKYTALDRPWFGLGVEGSFLWTRPSLIWLLPDEVAEPLAGIDLFIIPVKLTASFPVANWASFHLGVGYTHAEIRGELRGDSGFFEAGVGARTIQLDPTLHLYLNRRAALLFGGNIPVFMTAAERIESDIEVTPGVVLGVRSAEWVRVPTQGATRGRVGVELRFGRRTHLQVFVARGVLASADIGPPVLPSLNLYWRI